MNNTQHPVTLEKNARIDIYFGRHQSDAAEDVMTLIHQSLPAMKKDETILVVNSLCAHDDLVEAVDKVGRKYDAKTHVYSASGRKLREKLEFLSTLIVAKNVRMLIVNSFEFAACGSRQKHALVSWLREMRDANKMRVVIYSCERELPKFGALSTLGYAASSVAEVGKWRREEDYQLEYHAMNASEAVLQYAEDVVSEEAGASANGRSMTMQRRMWQGKLNLMGGDFELSPKSVAPSLATSSLKNKELDAVGAHAEILEQSYEMDYAMAA